MNYRRLGKSGLQVSELSFGSWITFGNQIGDKVSEELMKTAYDAGVNFFDNAEVYANGNSEIVMGKILKKFKWKRDSWLVSSKVFFGDGGKLPTQRGLNRKHIMEGCNAALNRLGVDYIDLFFCHRPDKQTPIEETVWTMHNLIQQGKILYWGTSEWSAQEIMEAHMFAKENHLIGPVMEQPQYNMLVRQKVEVEYAQIYKTVGLGTTIWSPLCSGILSGKYNQKKQNDSRLKRDELKWLNEKINTKENLQKVEKLSKIASNINVTLPQMAIAWCLENPNVSTVLLGASKLSQLKENLKAVDAIKKLTPALLEEIEVVLANKPPHPQY
jgi:voltage-dependent potassium channel beta subunit